MPTRPIIHGIGICFTFYWSSAGFQLPVLKFTKYLKCFLQNCFGESHVAKKSGFTVFWLLVPLNWGSYKLGGGYIFNGYFIETCVFCSLQILYYTDGELSIRPDTQPVDAGVLQYKGHDFLDIHYRTPTTCDYCNKPAWHVLSPPNALECKRE